MARVLTEHDVPSYEELSIDDVLAADAWAREPGPRADRHRDRPGRRRTKDDRAVYTSSASCCSSSASLVSIALHEVGHMCPAKKFGMKVTQYFVGFGRTVWSTKRGETEYGVKAIPLGGFVRIVGMLPPAKRRGPGRTVRKAQHRPVPVADRRTLAAAEYEHDRPADEDRLFYRKAWWKKLIVMAGGPMMNIVDRVRPVQRPCSWAYGVSGRPDHGRHVSPTA